MPRERTNAEAQADVIRSQRLLFATRAGENDRLYGSVTSADIADRLSEAVGFEVDRRKLQLSHPLRDLGIYNLEIRLIADVTAEFPVAVVREGETWVDAEARAAAVAKAKAAAAKQEEAQTAGATEGEEG